MRFKEITVHQSDDILNVMLRYEENPMIQQAHSVAGFLVKGHDHVVNEPRFLKHVVGFAMNAAVIAEANQCSVDDVWTALDEYCREKPLTLS